MSQIEDQPRLAVFWAAGPSEPGGMARLTAAIKAQRSVPGVLTLDHGPRAEQADWEGPDKTFAYGMIVSFESLEAGRAWVAHRVHQDLVQVILSLGAQVADIRAFWIGD